MGTQLDTTTGWSWRKDRWLLAPVLVPLGFTAWVAPVYVGVRMRRPLLVLIGLALLAAFVVAVASSSPETDDTLEGLVLLGTWIGSGLVGLVVRPSYDRFRFDESSRSVEAARGRIARREGARRLAAQEPELARELGVGRPDVPGSDHHGVVDPNAVPAETLAQLPGLDEASARRIAEVRREVGRFSSAEDLATLCDLEPDQLDAVRSHLVFLRA